jgi:acetolactate synthase-1/2/3 large subunit
MIKVSDYIVKYLENLGVKNIYTLTGGGCMHLTDSFGKSKKIKSIFNLHEQCSAICADAESQYTGKLGVTLVTTGPGGTNTLTGIAASWIDSIPILVLSGQVKTTDLMENKNIRQMGVQEVDIVSIVKSITKYAVTIKNPNEIKFHLDKAIYLATSDRKAPVWLDIPLDVQGAIVDEKSLFGFIPFPQNKNINSFKIKKLLKLINRSERPVILAGNGIRLSGGLDLFQKIYGKLKIPILTTWKAADFLDDDDLFYVGKPGSIGQRGANYIQQNSDLIICVGTRLDYCQTGFNYPNFAKNAKKVIVDIDSNEIDKTKIKYDLIFNVDANSFLKKLNSLLEKEKIKSFKDWLYRGIDLKYKYPVCLNEYYKEEKINPYVFINELSTILDNKAIIIPDSSGSASEITQQSFRIKKGQRFFCSPGLGSMGFAVAHSIGACIASDYKDVYCIAGDGSLQHNIQELELINRYKLPIKIFVFNNNGYNSIKTTQTKFFNDHLVGCNKESGVSIPPFKKIAECYRINYFLIPNLKSLLLNLKDIIENTKNKSAIIELLINPDILTQPKIQNEVLPDGKIVSKPMEDMFPFVNIE